MKATACSRLLLRIFLVLTLPAAAQSASSIYQRLKKLGEHTTVLFIAAHPDDENTHLLAWLSQEKNFRTAYLSLTRGDGGQNLIGSELGVDLGLIRTRELMAARAIDGGEQYFSQAFDFGFSKRPEETLDIWDRNQVLEDIVRVIRTVKPDIIICRFPPDSRAGHGHHSASAILAHEAFNAAADPSKFPDVPFKGSRWKAKAIYWNSFNFSKPSDQPSTRFNVEIGGYNPIIGKSYGELAAESRSQHKSQGFGVAAERAGHLEHFIAIDGDTLSNDLFTIADHYFESSAEGKKIKTTINEIISTFQPVHPEKSLPALLDLYSQMRQWKTDSTFSARKLSELQQIIADCMGLWAAVYATEETFATGDSIPATFQFIARNIDSLRIRIQSNDLITRDTVLNAGKMQFIHFPLYFKGRSSTSQPYWLNIAHARGMFEVEDPSMIGKPWNNPVIELPVIINAGTVSFTINLPVQYKLTDPVKGELERPLVITPELTATVNETVSVFNNNNKRTCLLSLTWHGNRADSVHLKAIRPAGINWQLSFNDTTIYFSKKGEKHLLKFTLQPVSITSSSDQLKFNYTTSSGISYPLQSLREINYPHIPKITWFPSLTIRLITADIKTTAKRILYIKGAGDEVAAMIRQLGVTVDEVAAAALEDIRLSDYDAVVTGIRAYNSAPDLSSYFEKINRYLETGGIFLIQYNTNNNLHPVEFTTPAPFQIGRNRVTEEDAMVQFTLADDPALNRPNHITGDDFKNWIQERGLYFATNIDQRYRQPLLMHDEGEQDQPGSLIILPVGKGTYIYTGLSFFRQLPAGVPGAFRLFANLISRP